MKCKFYAQIYPNYFNQNVYSRLRLVTNPWIILSCQSKIGRCMCVDMLKGISVHVTMWFVRIVITRTIKQDHGKVQAPMHNVMLIPLLNKHTGEAQCVDDPVEYHKMQYLKMSDSTHIWIPSWRKKKKNEIQKQTTWGVWKSNISQQIL